MSVSEDMLKLESQYNVDRKVEWYNHHENQYVGSSRNYYMIQPSLSWLFIPTNLNQK
jgi:hypothetical protein